MFVAARAAWMCSSITLRGTSIQRSMRAMISTAPSTSSATTSWAPDAEKRFALEQVARAHEHRHGGRDALRGVDHALGGLRVVHQQHEQPRVAQVRVAERLLAGGVAVVDGQALLLAAAHVVGVELEHDEAETASGRACAAKRPASP